MGCKLRKGRIRGVVGSSTSDDSSNRRAANAMYEQIAMRFLGVQWFGGVDHGLDALTGEPVMHSQEDE